MCCQAYVISLCLKYPSHVLLCKVNSSSSSKYYLKVLTPIRASQAPLGQPGFPSAVLREHQEISSYMNKIWVIFLMHCTWTIH